jgi:heterodisulfide reductase subunit A
VKTQAEFEAELDQATEPGKALGPKDIVMVFCAEGSQLERCSRVCCNVGIRQAIRAKELNPSATVTILFRELYVGGFGEAYEAELARCRKLGVTFFRYRQDLPPVIGDQTVDVLDPLTGEPLRLPFDRVVLTMPLVPQGDSPALAMLLGLPQDEAGFLAEPRLRLRPGRYVDAGIYVLGSAQQPADSAEALFQAYLTSARAARFLHQDRITIETPVASIDPGLCTGCGNCAQVCPTLAIRLRKRDGVLSLSSVEALRCLGCGNCVVVCPVKAIALPGWDDLETPAQISAALETWGNGGPKVLALACEWSAYGAADMAGVQRVPYPANVRLIRMNCSARFDPYHILWAFLNGADGVLLGACPPGECHYGLGNLYARERIGKLRSELAAHGVNPCRLRLEFLTVDDGPKFARAVADFVTELEKEGAG